MEGDRLELVPADGAFVFALDAALGPFLGAISFRRCAVVEALRKAELITFSFL